MAVIVFTLLLWAGWWGGGAAEAEAGGSRYGISYLPGWQGERLWGNLRDLGVGWVRIDLWTGKREYEERFGPVIVRALADGYGLWLTLMHRDRSNIADQSRYDQSGRGGFPSADPQRYRELIRRTVQPLVEQLRSRGKNPAEWLVIQIENEVAPEDVLPPNPKRFWHGTSDQYLAHLALAYEAVKSVDPSIPVAVAGIASEPLEPRGAGRLAMPEAGLRWLDRMLRQGRHDWADLHLYHRVETIPSKVAWIRERWNGPLAATEVAGPDERTGARYSEELHAEEVPRRVRTTLDAGVTRFFWFNMADAPTADRLGQTVGLTRTDGSRKPAFSAYQRVIRGDGR
jgi:hypothetical protein